MADLSSIGDQRSREGKAVEEAQQHSRLKQYRRLEEAKATEDLARISVYVVSCVCCELLRDLYVCVRLCVSFVSMGQWCLILLHFCAFICVCVSVQSRSALRVPRRKPG